MIKITLVQRDGAIRIITAASLAARQPVKNPNAYLPHDQPRNEIHPRNRTAEQKQFDHFNF